ncbi:MAG: TetR/AcrR family transcriptional regulator [Thermotaleaceae bacterium]
MSKKNTTRVKIMNVALKLFSEQGYYSTTTSQIASEAGVNEVTIFRHFKTKENLFQETTQNYVEEIHIDEVIKNLEGKDFEENIRMLCRQLLELYFANTKLYKVQMKLADGEVQFVKLKLSREFKKVLAAYFNDLKDQGKIQGNPDLMAVTLINSILGAFTIYVLTDNTFTDIPIEKMVDEHARQFAAYYKKV